MTAIDEAVRTELVGIRAELETLKLCHELSKVETDRLYLAMKDAERKYDAALAAYVVVIEADAKLLNLGGFNAAT
jgi:hypothetical protein